MSKEVNVHYPPILALLGAVLVVMKLLGEIDLAWIWVLAPFWAPWALLIGVIVVPVAVVAVVAVIAQVGVWVMDFVDRQKRRKRL